MTTEYVSSLLRNGGHKLCIAESFTGGGVAKNFVSLAGASDILATSLVCYAERAKHRLLGVKEETLARFGAVSRETVSEMLGGLKKLGLGDVFAATSGNAGPTAEKEGQVGLCYVGVMTGEKKVIVELRLSGTRSEIIESGIQNCISLIGKTLKNNSLVIKQKIIQE